MFKLRALASGGDLRAKEMLVQLEVVVPNKRIFMICEPDAIPDGPWWSTSDQAELPSELMRTGLVFELPIDKDPKVWQPSLEAHAWLFGAMGLLREAGTPAGGRAARCWSGARRT